MTTKDPVAEARAVAGAVEPAEARRGEGLTLDVREASELDQAGRGADALHVPRGGLEGRADPESPMAEARLTGARGGRTVHVLCASGARAAMAAATLGRMGCRADVIEGGLEGWTKAGLPVER